MKYDQERMEKLRADAEQSLGGSGPSVQSASSINYRKKYDPSKQFLKKMSREKEGDFNSVNARSAGRPSNGSKQSNKSAVDASVPKERPSTSPGLPEQKTGVVG